MAEAKRQGVHIVFDGDCGTVLTIYAPSGGSSSIQEISASEAAEFGEETVQLLEGTRYEYELSDVACTLREEYGSEVVQTSLNPHLPHCGFINTGIRTGRLGLVLLGSDSKPRGILAVEVRPRKLGHRDHYRHMLEDITEACVGLIMDVRAPTTTRLAPTPGDSASTIAQRFAFLKALIGSRNFQNAILRITTHPHNHWEIEERLIDVRQGFRATGKTMREIARAPRRVSVPPSHPLKNIVPTVPERISIRSSAPTLDTNENRFVKFALEAFVAFLHSMRAKLYEIELQRIKQGKKASRADVRLSEEIALLEQSLLLALNADMFRNLSTLQTLPLGSPVLQRKAGYREVLQAWLRFDSAARLMWHTNEDAYQVGQRDIATLYEYWVFFKLFAIVSDYFKIPSQSAVGLLEQTSDGFGLKLKSGRYMAFSSSHVVKGRSINVQFSYNRTFGADVGIEQAGSWTQKMRPDYTLSLWPSAFTAKEAERQELMVHVHFDAKYRADNLEDIFGSAEDEDYNSDQLGSGTYKRADLLKMHAYCDAIRRTHGAYVLYPGEKESIWANSKEILPGLGAFPLRPGGSDEQRLIGFIDEIVDHICDRVTQREQATYHRFKTYSRNVASSVHLSLPEVDATTGQRMAPIVETTVFVDLHKGQEEFEWILSNMTYVVCLGEAGEAAPVSAEILSVDYILLSGKGAGGGARLMRVLKKSSQLVLKPVLQKIGYPDISHAPVYLTLALAIAEEFNNIDWESIPIIEREQVLSLDALIRSCSRVV